MNKKDVNEHLEEIRRQLWLGHAALMVGSGFSKNAVITNGAPCPPNWDELAAAFIKKLYPISNDDKDSLDKHNKEIQSKKSVLQLAEEFETTFQRPALNELLKECIQDDNLLPGALHEALMNLPWVDVFTTNYDTLLERAAKNIINIKYDVVYKSDNLPHSESPRIIKLHGSFPSEKNPLIITEEDYRTYPEKYSPFVNTVQQAIMESTMCLIGFSGTDPNFLKWIGWVKDNLHDSMPLIYMIGLLKLSDTEQKVLEKKKIIPVDLSKLYNSNFSDHNKALVDFCTYLEANPFYTLSIDQESIKYASPEKFKYDNDIINVIKLWQKQHINNSHYFYLSWNRRSTLKTLTEQWSIDISYLKKLPDDWDIRGLYELNWRLEKCLLLIPNDLINDYDSILNKYDFYRSSTEKGDDELKKIWLELSFAVLRWSRETLNDEVWERYEKKIKESIENNSYYKNQLYYEQVYYAMAVLDLKKVETLIQQWDSIEKSLVWKMKYASIIAELGEVEKARQLWKETLDELRPKIPKSRIKNDFYYLGVEGCIILNLSMAEQNLQDFNDDPFRKKQENATSQGEDIQKRYQNRLQELEQYDCSPWDNIERFSLVFKSSESLENNTHIYREFDKVKTSYIIGKSVNQEVIHACQVLRFFEETGIALRVGNVNIANKTLQHSLPHMANIYPSWVFCILNRIGINNEKFLETCFSQKKIYQISAHYINVLLDFYIKQFKYIIENKLSSFDLFENNFYKTLVKNLYEVISRLTVKASSENLQKIFDLGISLYKMKDRIKIFLFSNKNNDFFSRLYNAMTPEQIFANLNEILKVKFNYTHETDAWPPPLPKDWRGFQSSPDKCTKELKNTINFLLKSLDSSDRKYRVEILECIEVCESINILTKNQIRQRDKNLLQEDNYVLFNLEERMKFEVASAKNFKSLNGNTDNNNFNELFNSNFNELFIDIDDYNGRKKYRTTYFIDQAQQIINKYSFFKTNNNTNSVLALYSNVELYHLLENKWNKQKQDIIGVLNDNNHHNGIFGIKFINNLQNSFICVDIMLGEVIIPRLNDQHLINNVKSFIDDIEKYFELPRANIAFLITQDSYSIENLYHNIINKSINAFCSFDYQKFDSYAHALFNAYRFAKKQMLPNPPEILLNTLINAIGMKSDPCFKSACSIVGLIFSFYEPDKTMCEVLLIYLRKLKEQTDFNSSSNRFALSDRYDYRQAAMFLATKLYYVYVRRNETIPFILEEWKKIGQSNEEFPSVRNTWLREQYRNMQK